MRLLYAFQGTGNGHSTRAKAILPELAKHVEIDVATSGMNSQLDINFPIKFRYRGISFQDNGRGALSPWKTARNLNPFVVIGEINSACRRDYNLVINDFEPITAYAAKVAQIPSIALSHQASFLSANTPRPKKIDRFAEAIFSNYAPTNSKIGFHFDRYDSFILTPLLRDEIRKAKVENLGHITVYLPGFEDMFLVPLLQQLAPKKIHIFSKEARTSYRQGNLLVQPVSNQLFIESLTSCDGFLTGAGFEGPAEALYLGKKLMVVPLAGQYEQLCNAAALERLGVPVITTVSATNISLIIEWANCGKKITIDFPETTKEVVRNILEAIPRATNSNTALVDVKSSTPLMSS